MMAIKCWEKYNLFSKSTMFSSWNFLSSAFQAGPTPSLENSKQTTHTFAPPDVVSPVVSKTTHTICMGCNRSGLTLYNGKQDINDDSSPHCMNCMFEKLGCKYVAGIEYNDYLSIRDMRHPRAI